MEFSLPHILILLLIIVILFGGRKIPEVMKGLGQGIREFKEGMRGDQPPTNPPPSNTTTTATNAPPPPAPEQKS
jgi:sec-independent protein translocase protein TatA